jgi:4-amino-4-deoxy-L-arabinose transferase-like glycosyltransferase
VSDTVALQRDVAGPDDGKRTKPDGAGPRVRQLLRRRLPPLLRSHLALVLLLLAGAAVRVAVVVAYGPAFGFYQDTGGYLRAAKTMVPSTYWPFGYSLLLKPLTFTGHIVTVAAVQHLLGLLTGVGVYALLARRVLPYTWCAVAAAPVLLDARQIILEHYVLSETLFTALLLAGLLLLLSTARPTAWMCALSGVVFASAALTRTVGQPLIVIVLGYLLVRRVGWRRVAAFAAAAVLPLVAYMTWYHHHHGVYALNEVSGRYLWSQTLPFVDCERPDFTADERKICPREPVGKRQVHDIYLWSMDEHHIVDSFPSVKDDPVFAGFAYKAILGQPVDFARVVVRDGIHLFQPGWQAPARLACYTDIWSMPSGDRVSGQTSTRCKAIVMPDDFTIGIAGTAAPRITALNGALWAYGRTFLLTPFKMLLLMLFTIGASCWRPRRVRPRDSADAVLLPVLAATLVMLSITLSVIEVRYTLPLVTILPPAAVLAWHRVRTGRRDAAGSSPASTGDSVRGQSGQDTVASASS